MASKSSRKASKISANDKAAPVKRKGRVFDAFPDRIDLRDWPYQPTLAPLPDEIVNIRGVPEVLDQGQEGACTGFALAAVINYLLAERGSKRRVSPRMLYEMARCYDEWPGEKYEGSSARGAMKGWARHGVCVRKLWPDNRFGRDKLTLDIGVDALVTPAGAYYRIKHREIRDVHAAIAEVGAVYATLMVHEGWDKPGPKTVTVGEGKARRKLPVIQRRKSADSGHAVALVGYTREGFIVQNSWGEGWGNGGFALLPYEDFLLHATDSWVAQLGVPIATDLWAKEQATDSLSGLYRARRSIPLTDIRPFVVDIGNNGELSQGGQYWTSEEDIRRLFAETIPAATQGWEKRRVLLYLHGGLNGERDVAKRVIAFRDVFLANQIYPLHIMWETGPLETLSEMIGDMFTEADERAGGGLLEGMREAKDRLLEISTAAVGGPMWSEMKENAWRASDHRRGKGGMQLMARHASAALEKAGAGTAKSWELHVVGHSAGSIFAAHALPHLASLGIPFKSLQLMAPAIRVDEFVEFAWPHIHKNSCPRPTFYILNEQQELDDTVGPYGKSLLWLVSNAFEDQRGTPILGVKHYLEQSSIYSQLNQPVNGLPGIVYSESRGQPGAECASKTHGGFDNDPLTLNSVLYRILGKKPVREFTKRDVSFE